MWSDRLSNRNAKINEAFANEKSTGLKNSDMESIKNSLNPKPSDSDVSTAYRTLLKYISNDFEKGSKFVLDFGERFYGEGVPLKKDLDVTTLMNNYHNPLQVA
jgi:hypothetical protein